MFKNQFFEKLFIFMHQEENIEKYNIYLLIKNTPSILIREVLSSQKLEKQIVGDQYEIEKSQKK